MSAWKKKIKLMHRELNLRENEKKESIYDYNKSASWCH